MPSESKLPTLFNTVHDTSGIASTSTSGQYNLTTPLDVATNYCINNTTGAINLTYTNTNTFFPNFSYPSIQNEYRIPKDGEIRIDPESGDSFIYLSEYNEWKECDILEIKKDRDANNNIQKTISVIFDFSVALLKQQRNDRIVLTEKIQKTIIFFDGSNNIIWDSTALGRYTLIGGSNITIGTNHLTTSGYYSTAIGSTTIPNFIMGTDLVNNTEHNYNNINLA